MTTGKMSLLALALTCALLCAGQMGQADVLNSAPAVFIENDGQWADSATRFALTGQSADVLMKDSSLELDLHAQQPAGGQENLPPEQRTYTTVTAELTAGFVGANSVTPVGVDQVSTIYNFSVGDQSTWRDNVHGFHTVEYQGLYDGIDLDVSSRDAALKYEFHVAPGSDYSQIAVHYDGASGLSLDDQGALHIQTALGDVVNDALYVYQVVNGQQQQVAGAFTLVDSSTYSFTVTGQYDVTKPLVIDPRLMPALQWSAYLIVPDDAENLGGTTSFAPSSMGNAIAVDNEDNSLVTGWAECQVNGNTTKDVFVSKVTSDGTVTWTTFFGGTRDDTRCSSNGDDIGYGIAVREYGTDTEQVWVSGVTQSMDGFAGHARTHGNTGYVYGDAFVALLDGEGKNFVNGSSVILPTCFGGDYDEAGYAIAIDNSESANDHAVAWITGQTNSHSSTFADGFADGPGAFVVRMEYSNANGLIIGPATSFGGGEGGGGSTGLGMAGDYQKTVQGKGIAIDQQGNAMVSGIAYRSPWYNNHDNGNAYVWLPGHTNVFACEDNEAFVSKVHYQPPWTDGENVQHPESLAVDWSTYVTANATDSEAGDAIDSKKGHDYHTAANGIVVDSNGDVLITGSAKLPTYEKTTGLLLSVDEHALLAKVAGQTGACLWTSAMDKKATSGVSLALDSSGNALVAGNMSDYYPLSPGSEMFVAVVNIAAASNPSNTDVWGMSRIYGAEFAGGIAMSRLDSRVAYVTGDAGDGLIEPLNHNLGDPDGCVSRIRVMIGGDANYDDTVDVLDLGILATNWGNTDYSHIHYGTPRVDWGHGDFNGDGMVDVLDLGILASNWQASLSS